ncbi:MAG: hypothetical protein FJY85_08030, partial [Deltaproteobacteria bacterium]|nr:hypothetical protein [Deltaproteobacteria bacterium]
SLYLDDLEDGLNVEEALSSMVQKLKLLREHEGFRGIPEALDILEAMERHASLVETGEGPVPFPEIDRLRSLLFDLRYHYPEEKFPLEARRPTEPEQPPVEAEPAIADAVSSFIAQLEKVPGMERSVIDALLQAGFSSMESLAGQGISDLSKIPGVAPSLARAILTAAGVTPPAPPERPVARARPERSLLADVDDELLHEFEGIFAAGPSLAGEPQRVSPRARGQRAADLLEELDAVSAESDREIMEIFLSYGWEILDKLRPVVRKISLGHADRSELDRAAELIKAIRSSSTYMDYQNLASFLDDWYEKTLWTSERFDSLSPRDTAFMEERLLRFDDFLVGLETVVNPDAAQGGADRLASARRPAPAPPFVHGQPQVGAAKGVRPMPTSVADQASPRRAKPPIVPAADEALLVETPTRDLGVEVPIPPGPLAPSAGPTEGQQPLEAPIGEPAAPLVFGADFPQEGALVKTMRVDSSKVDVLLNRVGELVVNRAFVEQLSSELKSFQRVLVSTPGVTKREVAVIKELALKVTEASVSLGRVANDIQEGVMKLRMLPVGQLFNRMPRLIRDLSRRVGKTVNLEVYGGDTEVDKRVIEQIYNPLVHLIRNAVDHGIEDAETRKGRGKSEEGSITLRAYSEGNQVVIDVEDDGGGIDKDAVIRRAVESRLIDVQDAKNISMQEIYNFLFLPGFSTSDK